MAKTSRALKERRRRIAENRKRRWCRQELNAEEVPVVISDGVVKTEMRSDHERNEDILELEDSGSTGAGIYVSALNQEEALSIPVQIKIKEELEDHLEVERCLENSKVISASEDQSECLSLSSDYNRCLLCYKLIKKSVTPSLTTNVAEANYHAMFVLRKMLHVPKERLREYLETAGSPGEWVTFCWKCLSLVNQALYIQKEISPLEEKLRKIQMEMLEEIESSWREEEQEILILEKNKEGPHGRWRDTHFDTSKAMIEIRRLISSRLETASKNLLLRHSRTQRSGPRRRKIKSLNRIQTIQSSKQDSIPPLSQDPEHDNDHDATESEECSMEEVDDLPSETSCCPGPTVFTHYNHDEVDQKGGSKKTIRSNQHQADHNGSEMYALNAGGYTCSSCPGLGGMTFASLIRHGVFHFKRPLKCSQCGLYFSSLAEPRGNPLERDAAGAEKHICSEDTLVKTLFDPGNVWDCATCTKTFQTDTDRDSHEISCGPSSSKNEIQLTHGCNSCSKKFRSMAEWLLHRTLEHPEVASVSCMFCDETFALPVIKGVQIPDVRRINSHINEIHPSYSIHKIRDTCNYCGAMFWKGSNVRELATHLEEVHGLTKNASFSCPVCHFRCGEMHSLKAHLQIHYSGKQTCSRSSVNWKTQKRCCEICGYKHNRKEMFLEHQFSKHGMEPNDGREILKCSKKGCGFRTLVHSSLSKHTMKEHGASRELVCQTCGKGFLTRVHLSRHEQIHLNKDKGIKPFQCEICGNSFSVQNYLYIHLRLSHQNRPFASTHKRKPSIKAKDKMAIPSSAVNNISSSSTAPNYEDQSVAVDDVASRAIPKRMDMAIEQDDLQQTYRDARVDDNFF